MVVVLRPVTVNARGVSVRPEDATNRPKDPWWRAGSELDAQSPKQDRRHADAKYHADIRTPNQGTACAAAETELRARSQLVEEEPDEEAVDVCRRKLSQGLLRHQYGPRMPPPKPPAVIGPRNGHFPDGTVLVKEVIQARPQR